MKVVIVVGVAIIILIIGVITLSLCAEAGRRDDYEEQMQYLKGGKKDDDVPM